MKKLLLALLILFAPCIAFAQLTTVQGGTGTTTPFGILYGDGTLHLKTVNISGCTFVGGTLTCAGSSGASYPFPLTGNATSTLTQFNGGITAYASSTIGDGLNGLTISGNSTTTGNSNIVGTVTASNLTPYAILSSLIKFTSAGSGYAQGDTITLTCSGCVMQTNPILVVGSVSGGALTNVQVRNNGVFSYIPATTTSLTQLSTSGSGTGAVFTDGFGPIAAVYDTATLQSGGSNINGNTFLGQQTPNPLLYGGENTFLGIGAGACTIGSSQANTFIGLAGTSGTNMTCPSGTLEGSYNTIIGTDAGRNSFGTTGNNVLIGQNAGRNVQSNSNTAIGQNVLSFSTNNTQIVTGGGNAAFGINDGSQMTSGFDNLLLGSSVAQNILSTGNHNTIIDTYFADTPTAGTSNTLNLDQVLLATGVNIPNTSKSDIVGRLGVGSSSPYAKLSVHANNGDTNTTLFAIGSSTATATTTLFTIDNVGNVTTSMTGTQCVHETNGLLAGTGSDCASGSGTFSFTPLTNFGVNTSATTTAIWAQNGLFASTTSQFDSLNISPNGSIQQNGSTILVASSTSSVTFGGISAGSAVLASASGGPTFGMTGFGFDALQNATTSQTNSTAFGYKALKGDTLISNVGRNTAIGWSTLTANTLGIDNTGVGNSSLIGNTTGTRNVGLGSLSGVADTTGGSNTSLGYNANTANISGNFNVAVGTQSLLANTGSDNIGIGLLAGEFNTTGGNNFFGGFQAGEAANNTQSDTNSVKDTFMTFLGTNSSRDQYGIPSTTVMTNSTAIGAHAQVGASNVVALGGQYANGVNVGIGTSTPTAQLSVHATPGNVNPLIFSVASSSVGATTTPFSVANTGWIVTSGNIPTVGTCGSTNNISGNQTDGTIFFTGTLVTSCSVNFPNPVPVGTTLQCTESDNSLAATADISATTTSSVTFGLSTGLASGAITWHCDASRNNNQ